MDSKLLAISPLDGRYHSKLEAMREIFSEYSLIKYRLDIEVDYFLFLCNILPELKEVTDEQKRMIEEIKLLFNVTEAGKVKEYEKKTNHDIKAVEYYLRHCFEMLGMKKFTNFIHFGLTSQDINSVAYVHQLWCFKSDVYSPLINTLMSKLSSMVDKYKDVVMLSRTHGQPASPTLLGKELMVFETRLKTQYTTLRKYNYKTKFGGAVGNCNAHYVAYPDLEWKKLMDEFVELYSYEHGFWMYRNKFTTQIDNYENYSEVYDIIKRINTVLIDLCQDMWLYISRDYFKIKIKEGEVGSSAMPHKVNPILFENAEGNLRLSNSLLEFLSSKLPVSRLQRDLTDSTVLRNVGVAFSHTVLGLQNIINGLQQLEANKTAINNDLQNNVIVLSEAIQMILRKENVLDAYELVRDFTRTNSVITKKDLDDFILTLDVTEEIKNKLLTLKLSSYVGKV